tara:strand:- start:10289 stop:10693 length:405 start_codon:yes stop_codon:yes gene_type:complete
METSTKLDLSQFTGSMEFARFGLTKSIMSQGVTHVATTLNCFWLVQDIDLHIRELANNGKDVRFVVAKLKPRAALSRTESDGAVLVLEDGNDNVLKEVNIPYTDFDFDSVSDDFEIWAAPNEIGAYTLYLPSEH